MVFFVCSGSCLFATGNPEKKTSAIKTEMITIECLFSLITLASKGKGLIVSERRCGKLEITIIGMSVTFMSILHTTYAQQGRLEMWESQYYASGSWISLSRSVPTDYSSFFISSERGDVKSICPKCDKWMPNSDFLRPTIDDMTGN